MRTNIRTTLLVKLLDRPRPIAAVSFRDARSQLFPGLETFRRFLATEREDAQKQAAREILLGLAHARNFGPPWDFLNNLFDFEETLSGRGTPTSSNYIAQDHFVHLANLYLTGIYLFAYHRGVHYQCRTRLRQLRSDAVRTMSSRNHSDAARLVEHMNDYEMFGLIWSYFILIHDLGYPLEAVQPEDRRNSITDELHPNLKPFTHIKDLVVKDLGVKILAHLVTLDFLLDDQSSELLKDHLPIGTDVRWLQGSGKPIVDGVRAQNSQAIVVDSDVYKRLFGLLGEAVQYPGIDDPFSLKLIFSALPDVTVCAVLEQSDTGMPVFLVARGGAGLDVLAFRESRSLPQVIAKASLQRLREAAFVRVTCPTGYEWRYFFLDAHERLRSLIQDLLGTKRKCYQTLREYLRTELPVQSRLAFGGDSSMETARLAFAKLSRLLSDTNGTRTTVGLDRALEMARESAAKVANRFPALLAEAVSEAVQAAQKKNTFDAFELLAGELPEQIQQRVIEFFSSSATDIAQRVTETVTPAMKREFEQVRDIGTCHESVRKVVEEGLGTLSEELISLLAPLGRTTRPFGVAPDRSTDLLRKVDGFLRVAGPLPLQELFDTYAPPFTKGADFSQDETYADHGLASAAVGLGCATVFLECRRALLSSPGGTVPASVRALRIALALGVEEHDHALDFELEFIVPRAIAMVAVHNLYPLGLPEANRAFRTTIRSDALSFVGMLSDGLQIWDRPKRANHARGDVPVAISGREVDVAVQDHSILVTPSGRIEVARALEQYKKSFDSYLGGASEMVQVRLPT